jgi:hypothetical protein
MTMKRIIAVLVVVAACGGGGKKQDTTLIEPDEASESCCCRIETDTPDDPTFTRAMVMECSSRHGTCLKSEAQCEGQPEATESTDSGALPPVVEETPNSF